MSKSVELRRHTASDGDVLTSEGIEAAVRIGSRLKGHYDLLVSSGAQRATQTLACFLAGMGRTVHRGAMVDERFRSSLEERWFAAYKKAGAGDIESFRAADPDLVNKEAPLFAEALKGVFDALPDGGSALIVGHSPMQEAAIYGLTGRAVDPIKKGAGVLVVLDDDGSYRVEPLDESDR
ncbi:MAG: histidine phosphatase family protein [Actinomycetota bacterium]|nr:histidine phosphatase family protein [Actinomycetota bacterium]